MTNELRDFRFGVSPEASASIHDKGLVILHVGSGRLYISNTTGARIWRGVEQQQPLEAIAEEISNEYQLPRSTAREHVAGFLADLEQHTLVRREKAL